MPATDHLPARLQPDAVIEAAFEARFDHPRPATVTEIFIGRLADAEPWKDFTQRRLPTADIPEALRRADPQLRYQPSVELVRPDGRRIIRLGMQIFGYVALAPYPGWSDLRREIETAIAHLTRARSGLVMTRLGLRYISALGAPHNIAGVRDLNMGVTVNGERLFESLNLNYTIHEGADTSSVVRVATPDLAQGNIPDKTTVLIDIDVFTKSEFQTSDIDATRRWVDSAHASLKTRFFQLLRPEDIERLRAK